MAGASLRAADGQVYPQGALPPGDYVVVEVRFVDGPVIYPGWPVTVTSGQQVVIRCDSRFETCSF